MYFWKIKQREGGADYWLKRIWEKEFEKKR